MKYFYLDKHKISKYCLGTWSLGGTKNNNISYGVISYLKVKKILEHAINNGINFFDTANVYGDSEQLLGEILKKHRRKIFIANKVGCISFKKKLNFSKEIIKKQILSSLKNLKTDYLDIVQLYNPNFRDKKLKEAIEYLDELKKAETIKYIGVSLAKPSDYIYLRRLYKFDVVQCNFNILDHRILENKIFKFLLDDGVKIFGRTILNFGIFSESFLRKKNLNFNKSDHRYYWDKNQIKLWLHYAKKIKNISRRSIENTCYRFCNSFKINSLIIGATSVDHINDAIKAKNYTKLSIKEINSINNI